MKLKTYKIGKIYQNDKYVPTLRLNGKWLEDDLNFCVGEEVFVYQGKEMILITKPNEKQRQQLEDERDKRKIKQLQQAIQKLYR